MVFLWSCVMLWMSQRKAVLPSTFFQCYWPPETMEVAKKKVIRKRNVIVNCDCLAMIENNTLQLNQNSTYIVKFIGTSAIESRKSKIEGA